MRSHATPTPLWRPELQAYVAEMQGFNAVLAQAPGFDVTTPAGLAAAREGAGAFGAQPVREASDRVLAGPGGELRLRVFVPDAVGGVYLHLHGGGWCLGRPELNDADNLALARRLGLAVVSVAYRLAPEHPYPAAPDDCEAAALWLLENARAEFGSERLLLGGESAGAHLAVLTLLRLRDRHAAADRFEAANLLYGIYDVGLTPSHRLADPNGFVTPEHGAFFNASFLPGRDREACRAPEISPLYADLAGLPPALFTVGTRDLLLDDTLFMARRWQAAGNPTELAVYPEAPHGFTLMPVEMGRVALARCRSFLEERLAGPAR